MLKSPLNDTHLRLGGRMVEFAGWSLPISFAGITEEHVHTRTACSVFDVSHMGRLKVTGADAQTFLDWICPRNLSKAEAGRCYYTLFCKEDGGILDDGIVSCGEGYWSVVCNGANRDKIVAWLQKHAAGRAVQITDETLGTAMLAIQGPRAIPLAQELAGLDLSGLKRYRFVVHNVFGMPVTIYRSGYTGEDGLEVVLPAGAVGLLAPHLFGSEDAPHPEIKPAGLGARDTLRIEAGMPLYGHELTEDWDPITAGQAWSVDLATEFIGVEALRRVQEQGPAKQLVGLELDGRRIGRQHHAVYAEGDAVGEVTSGTLSPTLGKSIAMAFVPPHKSALGTPLEVDLGKTRVQATVVSLPFYKRPK